MFIFANIYKIPENSKSFAINKYKVRHLKCKKV